jgi:hypothetical protein
MAKLNPISSASVAAAVRKERIIHEIRELFPTINCALFHKMNIIIPGTAGLG